MVFAGRVKSVTLESHVVTFRTPSHILLEQISTFGGERTMLELFIHELREADIVWDVGAGFGLYALFAGKAIGSSGRVVAFEPEPAMRSLLSKNIQLNNEDCIFVREEALADQEGTALLFPPANPNPGTGSLVGRTDYRLKRRGINVNLRTADLLVRSHVVPGPTVMKIDVEGAEGRVLEGAGDLLRQADLRTVFCEVHPNLLTKFDDTSGSVEQKIEQSGLHITHRIERGSEYHLVARR